MRLMGYPAERISILTTYNGQKDLLRDVIEARCARHPLIGRPHKVGGWACGCGCGGVCGGGGSASGLVGVCVCVEGVGEDCSRACVLVGEWSIVAACCRDDCARGSIAGRGGGCFETFTWTFSMMKSGLWLAAAGCWKGRMGVYADCSCLLVPVSHPAPWWRCRSPQWTSTRVNRTTLCCCR